MIFWGWMEPTKDKASVLSSIFLAFGGLKTTLKAKETSLSNRVARNEATSFIFTKIERKEKGKLNE